MEPLEIEFTAVAQEAPVSLASRLVAQMGGAVGCGCVRMPAGVGRACGDWARRPCAADFVPGPFGAAARHPGSCALGLVASYAAYCALWAAWFPFAWACTEYGAWLVVAYLVRRGGGGIARFAVYPGSFGTVRRDVEKEYARRLLARLERCGDALEALWIDLHPRSGVRADRDSFLRRAAAAVEARDAVLRPLAAAADAVGGGGGRDARARGEAAAAGLPDLTDRARRALGVFRDALGEASDAVDGAEAVARDLAASRDFDRAFRAATSARSARSRGAGAAAGLRLMAAARALAAAGPPLRAADASAAGRARRSGAARALVDAGAALARLARYPCPPPADSPLGLDLLRAEFARAYGARQVWIAGADGHRVDACVVPPGFGRAGPLPARGPDDGDAGVGDGRGDLAPRCCWGKRDGGGGAAAGPARGAAAAVPTVLFFSPNAVLYESFGMAPLDGPSWVATYARLGLQVVVWNGRGYGRTRGTPRPAANAADALAIAAYLRETCGVPKLLLHGESIGGMAAARVAAALAPPRAAAAPRPDVALVADRTFSNLPVEAQYLVGVSAVAPLLRAVTGWAPAETDSLAAFSIADCPKLVANDCRDHMIPDAASLKAGLAGAYALGDRAPRKRSLAGALRLSDGGRGPPPPPAPAALAGLRAGAPLTAAAVDHCYAACRHVFRVARDEARGAEGDLEAAGRRATVDAASVIARVDGGCGMALGQAVTGDVGELAAWASCAVAWPNGAPHKLLDGPPPNAREADSADSDGDASDASDDAEPCAPPIAARDAADALDALARARPDDLAPVAAAVDFCARFLEKIADLAGDGAAAAAAEPVLGTFLPLGCGHNAPWRKCERDAYLAWLARHLS